LGEEDLPRDFIDGVNECEDLTSVVEDVTSSDANKSSTSQVQSHPHPHISM
jgi:hypothetical protein